MAYPPSLATKTVTGRFITHPDGTPAKGTVKFTSKLFVQGPADDLILTPFEAKLTLDSTGGFSLVLPATDDPDWVPVGWRYSVVAMVAGKSLKAELALPVSGPDVVDLADVLDASPVPEAPGFCLAATLKGAAGGLAELGPNGKVPAAQLPPGNSGQVEWTAIIGKPNTFPAERQVVTWTEVQGKPATFPAAAHGHAWSEIADKPATYAPSAHGHVMNDLTGTLGTGQGGTGMTTFTTSAYLRAASSTELEFRSAAQVLSDIGAAAVSHTHDASAITAGTLATARGGTGLTSFTANSYVRASSTTALQFRTAAQVLSDIGAAASSHTHTLAQITDAGAKVLVLAAGAAVPGGTAAGTVIVRTA
ncbi:hypothetical protein ACIA8K_12595 [Catenuloplanes sp. NPDC051500]|uniref:hypothetical protein n=1 Tax=Catenuloplanes sp. NPDC051500 TaxID=3363959 RepID=UPI00378DE49A